MDASGPVPIVALRNAGETQITVETLHGRHADQRPTRSSPFRPAPQVVRQVLAKRDRRTATSLLHARIDDPTLGIDECTLLFMRGTGPIGYPGAAEVVNMRPPVYLIKVGVHHLPCIGDGRQSGTSGSPSILNASPEAAVGGGLALLKTGDRVRVDLRKGEANILISNEELETRRKALNAAGGYPIPASQTPWQEIQRATIGQAETGAVLEGATKYQKLAQTVGVPRHNH